ncbi:MAG: hypothetical protein IKF82_08330 [Bacilli bacterium]|nr:hypothetical protein [Bacilli bacterium]
MSGLTDSLKRILKNKNTVTIIGVVAILVLLYFGYDSRIKAATRAISVPVAAEKIPPRTEITSDMITTIDMPSISLEGHDNVIRNVSSILGRYTNVSAVVPAGSMFYTDVIVDKKDLPDYAITKVEPGEVLYSFPVDMESTYGNSILPDKYIDIYMKVGDGSNEKVMIGKLLEHIKVLAVKDSSGKPVFEDGDDYRTPSMMLFGLSQTNWALLSKAAYLSMQGVELFPVPVSGEVDESGATKVSTQQLADYINARSVDIPITEITPTANLKPSISVSSKNNTHTVTITYPDGCKDGTYACSYVKNNEAAVGVTSSKEKVKYTGKGTLVATVLEADGTEHKLETAIPTGD